MGGKNQFHTKVAFRMMQLAERQYCSIYVVRTASCGSIFLEALPFYRQCSLYAEQILDASTEVRLMGAVYIIKLLFILANPGTVGTAFNK